MNTNPLRWLAIAAAVLSVAACKLEGDEFDPSIMTPSAIVTVKPDAENTYFWMQLNDETVLHAVNMKTSPFGTKEVRALVNYRKPTAEEMQKGGLYDDAGNVYVNWMDSIRTKKPVPDLGPEENVKAYGNDPVEIVGDWMTNVEDGYITLRFRTYWNTHTVHSVNLVTGSDPDDPYKVVFYHDAGGDRLGQTGDALVAFRLEDLPDTKGQTVDLTLEWNSFSGTKTAKFPYCTRP